MNKSKAGYKPRIVVIGGGTGSFTLLQALKNEPCRLTALASMADNGGSSGMLRDELGVLPPGDIRQCLVALSSASEEVRQLFNFRFGEGSLTGHSFGNLFLSAVEKMTDDFTQAIKMAGDVLRIKGQVIPVTQQKCNLVLTRANGMTIGQSEIYNIQLATGEKPALSLEPLPTATPTAVSAIQAADMIVIAPGHLYGSLAPALLVPGIAAALQNTTAPVVYVCNLVNVPQHTADYAVHDYAQELERIIGAPVLRAVLYNTDQPSAELLQRYALEGEHPVQVNQAELDAAHYKAIGGNFLSKQRQLQSVNSPIKHSLIRHDAEAVAKELLHIVHTIQ